MEEGGETAGSEDTREREERGDEDVLRILVATDTHLGYKAEDSERGGDSFETFEEILEIGRNLKVDFLLHGGDLFDENRPSRATMYRTFCLLRKFCFGDGAVSFEVLQSAAESSRRDAGDGKDNDAAAAEKTSGKKVDGFRFGLNYLDENINVCMPIFAMHGNHDDPGEQSHLSPLDLLEAAHLINYFGRCEASDEVTIKPILIRKGRTKVAIYGVGWIRDARLHRAFNNEKVRFLVPSSSDSGDSVDDWFNIMVVHQNMYKGAFGGQPAKNCIHEQMLPDFLDLAIWGHEHDCHVDLRESPQGTFRILQPGSSIATSLVAGEALPKHVFLLEVRGENYRITPQRLRTVRPLIFEDLTLADLLQAPPLASSLGAPAAPQRIPAKRGGSRNLQTAQPAEDRDVWQLLTDAVEALLSRYALERGETGQDREEGEDDRGDDRGGAASGTQGRLGGEKAKREDAGEADAFELFCNYSTKKKKKLPLLRLRVEHSGFSTVSTSRFGAQFVGRVANPGDILHFYRKRATTHHPPGEKLSQRLPDLEIEEIAGDDTSEIRDIIFHFLEEANTLDLLPEPDFNVAVQDFVVKMDTNAIAAFVDRSVQAARREAKSKLHVLAPDVEKDIEPADVHAVIAFAARKTVIVASSTVAHPGVLDGRRGDGEDASATGEVPREEEDDFAAETVDTSQLPEKKPRNHNGSTGLFDEEASDARATDSDFSDAEAGGSAAGAASRGTGLQRARQRGLPRGCAARVGEKRGARAALSLVVGRPSEEFSSEAAGPQKGRRGLGRRGRVKDASSSPNVHASGKTGTRGNRGRRDSHDEDADFGEEEGNQSPTMSARTSGPAGGGREREKPFSQLSAKRKGAVGGLSSEPKRQQADLRSFFRPSQISSSRPASQTRGVNSSPGYAPHSRMHPAASEGDGHEGSRRESHTSRFHSARPPSRPASSCEVDGTRQESRMFQEEREAQREGQIPNRSDKDRTATAATGYSLGTQEFTRKRRSSYMSEDDASRKGEESLVEDEDDLFLSSLGRAADSALRRGTDSISSSWSRRR
ncbi:putative double-strand break repair protein [Neospora caninum Liverpool]|uniref:Putative double-strand break repair protein n=1 Tax=Neospora caninum (strain Liverpool) TaxID=572307 RepID=F0VRM5_NEOCL|nr:putative double-strand break repair protein [Neospora caninum Liverpool]CBZ56373.1 putative double-strand break repair protein [Neospora caninum Liverpool]|eukprot:XP_003886398.1 putative double-strand break repair protein [Neospora caninum Liverpool]